MDNKETDIVTYHFVMKEVRQVTYERDIYFVVDANTEVPNGLSDDGLYDFINNSPYIKFWDYMQEVDNDCVEETIVSWNLSNGN